MQINLTQWGRLVWIKELWLSIRQGKEALWAFWEVAGGPYQTSAVYVPIPSTAMWEHTNRILSQFYASKSISEVKKGCGGGGVPCQPLFIHSLVIEFILFVTKSRWNRTRKHQYGMYKAKILPLVPAHTFTGKWKDFANHKKVGTTLSYYQKFYFIFWT